MLVLPIDEVKPGMTLAASITHPQHPEQELLKRGYILEDGVLGRMRDLGIDQVYVDYPGLEDLDRHLAPSLSPARQQMYLQVRKAMTSSQGRTRAAVSYSDYYFTTRELITTLLTQGQHPVYLEHMNRLGTDAIAHATAVAHLALLLGLKLENYLITERRRLLPSYARDVVNLGVGAMLHDIGKTKLPEDLQKHHSVNPPHRDHEKLWQEHSRMGHEMITQGLQPTAAAAILHHHQHYDGTGFPRLVLRDNRKLILQEHQIHVFSRILFVADLFDRITTPNKLDEKRCNLESLEILNAQYSKWCDPVIVAMLRQVCPPFPPGCQVGLSDGSRAVVVDINANDPMKPFVKRYVNDTEVDPKRLDLKTTNLTITRVGNKEVSAILAAAAKAPPAANSTGEASPGAAPDQGAAEVLADDATATAA